MAVKLIDPEQREVWTHPEDPDFTVTIRPVAIPTMTVDLFILGEKYIESGVVSVSNPEPVAKPVGGWCSILPGDIQTALFVEIQGLSKLSESEEQD